MARVRVWQGIREWFRPLDHDASASLRRRNVAPATSVDSSDPSDLYSSVSSVEDGTFVANAAANISGNVVAFPGPVAGRGSVHRDSSGSADAATIDEFLSPVSDDAELLEFLAADLDPIPADPSFRERLREDLWDIVRDDSVPMGKGDSTASRGPADRRDPRNR